MVKDNTGSERSEFVGELIDLEEAIERLQNAQKVTAGLLERVALANAGAESLRAEVAWRDEIIKDLQGFMRRLSSQLAGAGDYAHKEKNEVLLRVIRDLLLESARTYKRQVLHDIPWDDDVPF